MTPENSAGIHLKLLAQISKLLRDDDVKARLMQAQTPEDVLTVIAEEDKEF
jgi:PTS system nitrogen regulatory IIA component